MKKLVLVGAKKTKVIDAPIPEIKDNEILVKVLYCGVCMSEHYSWLSAGENNGINKGFGHEPMGIVEAVGKDITKLKVGDRVTGWFLDSSLLEFGVSDEEHLFKIPDDVADTDAIGEPLACLVSAVSKVPMSIPGEASVAVVGCGYMGCGAISLLKMRGAGKIVAVDIRKESLENALKYGADEAYLPEELPKEYIADMDDITKPAFDYVMEWGETEESLDLAIKLTKQCGFLGIGAYHTGGNRSVNVQLLNVKAIDCKSTHPREVDLNYKCIQNAMNILSSRQWIYQKLPTKVYPLSKFDQAHEELETKFGKYMKAIVDCQMLDGEPYIING